MSPYGEIDLGQHWLREWLVELLSETVLTYLQWGFIEFTWNNFFSMISNYQSLKWVWNYTFKIIPTSFLASNKLIHWGRVTHIWISKVTIISSDNGLAPGRHQAIVWNDAGISLIQTWGTNFSEMSSEMHTISFKNMHLKMSSGKWRPYYLGLNVLNRC